MSRFFRRPLYLASAGALLIIAWDEQGPFVALGLVVAGVVLTYALDWWGERRDD